MINLVVAMPSEARVLVDALRLSSLESVGGFQIFGREQYRLIVSGIGQAASATAVGWLAASEVPEANEDHSANIWLNVGIAGHQTLEPGQVMVANKVVDEMTGGCWFPSRLVPFERAGAVHTVSRVETVYPHNAAYDMEASAFFSAACRFSTLEFVQCIKIVSDGPRHSVRTLNRDMVRGLVAAHCDAIVEYLAGLETLSREQHGLIDAELECAARDVAVELKKRWHFTASQSLQLETLLRRYLVLGGGDALRVSVESERCSQLGTARLVLEYLQQELVCLPSGFAL